VADTSAVEVNGLWVKYGDFAAVRNVTFSVVRGEIFGFLGANGAGKTTTIRVLCGLLTPTEGTVRVCDLSPQDGLLPIKRKVGYMSQKFTLYNDLSVGENLDFTASLHKLDPAVYRKQRDELLRFIAFDRPLNTMVLDLPGGIKQQVSLAASLLHNPEVIFLDEPTAGVTPAARVRFWELIRQLAGLGKTIFVTTHYMDEAEQCQRVALMRDGELIAIDTPANLKKSTFPQPLLELEPTTKTATTKIAEWKSSGAFDLFEPYGIRYHASVADQKIWKAIEADVEQHFHIKSIKPSLEDVFIRLVEGKSHGASI